MLWSGSESLGHSDETLPVVSVAVSGWRLQTVLRSLISRFPLGWSPYSEVVEWLRFLPEVITSWAMPLPPPPLPPPSALTRSPCRDAWLWFGLMEGTSATTRKQCRINSYSLD